MAGWLDGEWTDEIRSKTAKQLRGFIFTANLQEGFEIFRSGSVKVGVWENKTRYEAEVADGYVHSTAVDLGFLPFSRCSCNAKGSCRHMAAAVFHAMRSKGINVQEFLEEQGLRQPTDRPKARESVRNESAGRAVIGNQIRLASAAPARRGLAAAIPAVPPAETDSCIEWHRKWSSLLPYNQKAPASYADWIEYELERYTNDWQDGRVKLLYRAHALLYAMKLADISFADSFRDKPLHELAVRLINGMQEAVQEWEAAVGSERTTRLEGLRGLADMASEYAFEHVNALIDWLYIYRFFAWRMAADPEWITEERKSLSKRLDSGRLHAVMAQRVTAAVAHLVQVEEGDKAAVGYLDRVWNGLPYLFFDYLYTYSAMKLWDRLEVWLNWLKPRMASSSPEAMSQYLDVWKRFIDNDAEPGECEQRWLALLVDLLPGSFDVYSNALLEEGNYRRWADLHMWMDMHPGDSKGFRQVESKAPEVLLPFLHQTAARWIANRNREGYRHAVRCMQVLKNQYAKMHRDDAWEEYIARILKRYPRMRSLHEEMRRGNILI